MDIERIQQAMLKQHQLRVSTAMGQYILQNLDSSTTRQLPIIAGDARTGVPLRTTIPLDQLRDSSQAMQ